MEPRPSAATASLACTVPPSVSSMSTCASPGVTLTTAAVGMHRTGEVSTALQSAEFSAEFGKFAPRLASPSSSALKRTSGARSRPPRSSAMRTPPSGAACPAQCRQTPRIPQHFHAAGEESGGASILCGAAGIVGRSDQCYPQPGRCQSQGCGHGCRSSTDHCNVYRIRTRERRHAYLATLLSPLLAHPSLRPQSRPISAMDWPSIDDREPPSALCAS